MEHHAFFLSKVYAMLTRFDWILLDAVNHRMGALIPALFPEIVGTISIM